MNAGVVQWALERRATLLERSKESIGAVEINPSEEQQCRQLLSPTDVLIYPALFSSISELYGNYS